MPKTGQRLSAEQLAKLFAQLTRLESAGLPALQALAILTQNETELKKPLAVMRRQLKAGQPLSEAGFRAGIFNDAHKTLIRAAETSGQLTLVYGQLAEHYTRLSSRIKKIKSRLYFPFFMLAVSLFIQPLPNFISSEINGLTYLQLSLGRLLGIGFGLFLLLRLPEILRGLGIEPYWHRLQLQVPGVAKWIINRQINDFFIILALMLEAGLAFADAFPKAVATIKNSCLREKFTPAMALTRLVTGASVTDTLAMIPVIDARMIQIVRSSEQSGKLAGGILHFSRLETETIGLQDNALAEWLPRLIYAVIALWMAFSILGGQFSMPAPN